MTHFDTIKLVIWDLDDTFWKGTISDGAVIIPDEHIELVKSLCDIGIVNSICSKNDRESTLKYLSDCGLSDYFVFPSIDWSPKGQRISKLISDMQLRPCNVLFLDDNPSNLAEAVYYCKDISVGGCDTLSELMAFAKNAKKKDKEHKRLLQYRILEKKFNDKKQYSTNEEFLHQSNINVEIKTDCTSHADRIHDLLIRSNQLNFTKVRSTEEELAGLLCDPDVKSAYVEVKDKFGDYGIAGFYSLKNGKLIHFVFSCRILGMGVEQYVYNILGRPELAVSGEVVSDLSASKPEWINKAETVGDAELMKIDNLTEHTVLIKGPCDLFQIYPYIANTELFDTEFTYGLPNGLTIESTGHTTNIVESLRLSEEEKERVVKEVPFADMGMYCDNIYKYNYKVVVLSILTDANLGVYRRKETGEKFAFLEYIHPITDVANYEGLISGEYNTAGYKFTEEILSRFSENYEFVGRNNAEQLIENLTFIRANLPTDCVLAIMLGGEMHYEKNTFEAYKDRHLIHREFNSAVKRWADGKANVKLIDVNRYLVNQSSFYDHFNHYIKPVYYSLAADIVKIVNDATGSDIRETSKLMMTVIRFKEILSPAYRKIRRWLKI